MLLERESFSRVGSALLASRVQEPSWRVVVESMVYWPPSIADQTRVTSSVLVSEMESMRIDFLGPPSKWMMAFAGTVLGETPEGAP